MAWLLRFDGVNDYLSYPSSVGNGIANAGDDNQHWELEFETTLDNPSNTYVYRPIESTTISRVELLFRKSDGLVRFVSPASGQYQWTGIDLSAPVIKMKLTKPLGVRELQVSINDGPAVSDTGGDNSCDFDVFGVNSSNGWLQGDLSYIKFTDFVTPANNLFSNAASSGGTGQILPDDIGTNNANLINFPTDNSQWISTGGGSINVTGQTANYNYSAIPGSVELTGEITVTGGTANYNYSGINGSVELTGEIVVNGQTANYNYTGLSGSVLLQGQINVIGQTASYDYTGLNASVLLSGEIVVTGQTANYDYFSVGATINLFDIWQIKDPVSTNWTAKDKELTDWGIKDPVTTVWSKK